MQQHIRTEKQGETAHPQLLTSQRKHGTALVDPRGYLFFLQKSISFPGMKFCILFQPSTPIELRSNATSEFLQLSLNTEVWKSKMALQDWGEGVAVRGQQQLIRRWEVHQPPPHPYARREIEADDNTSAKSKVILLPTWHSTGAVL